MKLYWGSSCGDTGCRGRHFGGRSKGKYGSIGDWSKFSRFIKFENLAAGPRESMDLLGIGLNSPALSSLRLVMVLGLWFGSRIVSPCLAHGCICSGLFATLQQLYPLGTEFYLCCTRLGVGIYYDIGFTILLSYERVWRGHSSLEALG
jgi:hypothetical protein